MEVLSDFSFAAEFQFSQVGSTRLSKSVLVHRHPKLASVMNPIHVSVELKTSDSLIRTGHSALDIESSTYSALNVAVTVKPNVSSVFLCPIRGGYAIQIT